MREARTWYREEVGFRPLLQAVRELGASGITWMVSSGWAVDLYLGRVTRVHNDVDVSVFRDEHLALQAFMQERGWAFVVPNEGRLEPWPAGVRIERPRHQAHAHKDGQFIDFLLDDREGAVWRFRREPAIARSLDRLILRSDDGIPFLAPEVALLFKSAHRDGPPRDKDQGDFEHLMQAGLDPERQAWLRRALEVYRPGHAWLDRLARNGA